MKIASAMEGLIIFYFFITIVHAKQHESVSNFHSSCKKGKNILYIQKDITYKVGSILEMLFTTYLLEITNQGI